MLEGPNEYGVESVQEGPNSHLLILGRSELGRSERSEPCVIKRFDTYGKPDVFLRRLGTLAVPHCLSAGASPSDGSFVTITTPRKGSVSIKRFTFHGIEDSKWKSPSALGRIFDTENSLNLQVQSDGCVLIWGASNKDDSNSLTIARLNPDGSFDGSFGNDGQVTISDADPNFSRILVQADKSIFVLSNEDSEDGDFVRIVKITSKGSVDFTYGIQGRAHIRGGELSAAASDVDGSLYVASEQASDDEDVTTTVLVRVTPGGVQDMDFGNGGRLTISQPGKLLGLGVQPGGKFLTLVTDDSGSILELLRFTRSGDLDSSFAQGGRLLVTRDLSYIPGHDGPGMLLVQRDGRLIVVSASFHPPESVSDYKKSGSEDDAKPVIVARRYSPDGAIDQAFGRRGFVVLYGFTELTGIGIDKSGRILAVRAVGEDRHAYIVRYTPDGAIDRNLNGDGVAVLRSHNGSCDAYRALSIDLDYRGFFNLFCAVGSAIMRFDANGKLRAISGSRRTIRVPRRFGRAQGLYGVHGKLRFVVTERGIVKLRPNGEIDRRFAENGFLRTAKTPRGGRFGLKDLRGQFDVHDLAVDRRGRVFAGGFLWNPRVVGEPYGVVYGNPALRRYTASGRRDTSFGQGGTVVPRFMSIVKSIDLVRGGRLLVEAGGVIRGKAGKDQHADCVWRFYLDGRVDKGYGKGGRVCFKELGVVRVLAQGDGGAIVVSKERIVRLTRSGVIDRRFGHKGIIKVRGVYIEAAALQGKSRLVVAGENAEIGGFAVGLFKL